jgi:hypothetical protein
LETVAWTDGKSFRAVSLGEWHDLWKSETRFFVGGLVRADAPGYATGKLHLLGNLKRGPVTLLLSRSTGH